MLILVSPLPKEHITNVSHTLSLSLPPNAPYHQLRVLRNDFARYNLMDGEEDDIPDQDDIGWKIINTDVFRFPPHKSLLCAILGQLECR